MCRTEGNSDRRNRRRGLTAAAVSPGGFACAAAPAALFLTLPHDHGCRFKPNADPAAFVYAASQPTPHLNISAVYVHFQTAGFLKAKTPTTWACEVLTGSERIRPVDLEFDPFTLTPNGPFQARGRSSGSIALADGLVYDGGSPGFGSSGSFEASQA